MHAPGDFATANLVERVGGGGVLITASLVADLGLWRSADTELGTQAVLAIITIAAVAVGAHIYGLFPHFARRKASSPSLNLRGRPKSASSPSK